MDPMIEALVTKLRDTDVEVRKEALDKLSEVDDRKYVVPAIHWTMMNDMDEEIRSHARKIYERMGELEKAGSHSSIVDAGAGAASAGSEESRTRVRPAMGWPNLWGTWSIHFSLLSILIIIVAMLWCIPYGSKIPRFLQILEFVGLSFAVPGMGLGVAGMILAGERKRSTSIGGLVLNGIILLIGIWKMIMTLRS